MSRRQIKTRLAMPLLRRNKMLLNNRPCPRNTASHRSPRNQNRKIRRTLAHGRDQATAVPEARAPGKLQNHLEPGTAPVDRRLRPTHRRLPQGRLRGKHRRQNRLASRDNDRVMNLKAALQVVSGEIEH